jgi:hypothetical protein
MLPNMEDNRVTKNMGARERERAENKNPGGLGGGVQGGHLQCTG